MARKADPVKLRPVDEESTGAPPVVRLVNTATDPSPVRDKPVRLGVVPEDPGTRHLLELPDKDEVELRTHQPGVEALYEAAPDAPPGNHAGTPAMSAPAGTITDTPRSLPLPWGLFGLAALVVGVLVFAVFKPDRRDDAAAQGPDTRAVETAVPRRTGEEEARRLEQIESTLNGFFAADSVETMARMVRHRPRVLPLMRAWYHDHPVYIGSLKFVRNLRMLSHGGREDFWWAAVTLENGAHHEVVLQVMSDGTALVDWETLVRHQPMPWQEFVRSRPAGAAMDFRVRVELLADTGNGGAAPFRLSVPGDDVAVTGLAKRGGDVERALQAALAGPGGTGDNAAPRRANLILRLRFAGDAGTSGAVLIEKVVNQGWIFIESPDTDS